VIGLGSRLRRADAWLLALGLAAYGACLALHLAQAWRGQLAWVPVYVAPARDAGSHPVVRSFWSPEIAAASELAPGDEILAVGGASLRGAGRLDFLTRVYQHARVYRHARVSYEIPLEIRSGGSLRQARLELLPVPLSWRASVLAVAFVGLGALAFWRTRGFGPARLFFGFAFCYGLHWSYFWGGPPLQTLAGIAAFTLGPTLALPLAVRATLSFPLETASRGPWSRIWPWLFGLAGVGGATWAFGGPLPTDWGLPLAAGGSVACALAVLAILTRNYRRSGPTGRRQIKWVLIGIYGGLVPILLAGAATLLDRNLWWLYEASLVSVLCIPLGLFVALSRDHLYDVDRLISAAATYTVLSVLLIAGLLVAVPRLARLASAQVDPALAQMALSLGVALVVVGSRSRLDPWVQRLLFRERAALERGAFDLRRDLATSAKPRDLLELLGERLEKLLAPECLVIYLADAEEMAPVFARGPAAAPGFDPDGALAMRLAAQATPLRVPARRRQGLWRELDLEEGAALEAMSAAVLAPLRSQGELAGFVCLGGKRSGDVYTEMDLALLGSIADKASDELDRFRDLEIREAERTMSAQLRRYVPGALAEQLERGAALQPGVREVTVLFVDIRGYAGFAEPRTPQQIFEAVSAYTQTVSRIVREHGGTIVEFNGDGMMAVFGAPEPLPEKERAAVDAARAIRLETRELVAHGPAGVDPRIDARVGIATGPAYVGSIQAVDRAIWSALGNTTNLASRLQSVAREREVGVVIDEHTHRAAAHAARGFVSIGIVPIRGRQVPVEVFTLEL
jgi:class 3 adenylate cyclase